MKKHLCPACGQEIDNSQKFCPNCGCPLSWVDCPACGHEIEKGQNFCPNCGCSITLIEEQHVEISPTEEVIENQSPVMEEATKKVTILGDSEVLINWTASILKNDIKIGEISPNEKVELDIDEECYLKFNCSLGSTICKVKPGGCVVVYCDNKGLKCKVTNGANDINDKSPRIMAYFALFLVIIAFIYAGINVIKNGKEEQQRIEQQRIEQQRIEQERREQEEQRKRERREQRQRELENKWKEFAGRKYKATTLVANFPQHYAFSYDNSGHGKYIVFSTYPGTDVVEDMLIEADIYRVTSDGDYLYLYIDGLRSPAKVKISGNSLYTAQGEERYYIWD